jgi:hypothetical protein
MVLELKFLHMFWAPPHRLDFRAGNVPRFKLAMCADFTGTYISLCLYSFTLQMRNPPSFLQAEPFGCRMRLLIIVLMEYC